MLVGYIHISAVGQNSARQEVLMQGLGVERAFIENQSGKDTRCPELKQLLDYVREGDIAIVESIHRFARNTRDMLELVQHLTVKAVDFVSKKQALVTTTPSGCFVMKFFGVVAQMERELLLQ